jgi:hypothetical protein
MDPKQKRRTFVEFDFPESFFEIVPGTEVEMPENSVGEGPATEDRQFVGGRIELGIEHLVDDPPVVLDLGSDLEQTVGLVDRGSQIGPDPGSHYEEQRDKENGTTVAREDGDELSQIELILRSHFTGK